jgi:two-component system, OmpR family, response regulator MprA
MKGVRVLVVDDEPAVREAVADALRLDGYDVELAVNGSEALGRMEEAAADVVVLDVLMPRVDGIQVCHRS